MENTFGIEIIPPNETERLIELERFNILNTPPEDSFNHMVSMVARIFNVPISLISFVSKDEVFFKANYGFAGHTHSSRGVSLCALAILSDEPTVFENTIEEPCLLANPLVHGKFGLQFYAGVPLKTSEGFNIGTLCILDFKQRFFSKDQIKLLEDFADVVMYLLNLRRQSLQSQ